MFKLVISDDEGKPTVVPLVRDEVSIGRAEGNTIRLTDRNVSRKHAVLAKEGEAFTIRDLDSYNGVFVNGAKVEGTATLRAGDQVRIGDYQIALHVDSSEATDAAETPGAGARGTRKESGPPARLVMLTLPVPGAEFALSGDHMRLGRSEDLDIWINHRSISREHAEILRDEDGRFRILDMGSANGVHVNGEDVEESDLEPYDVIKLGRVRLRYVPAGEAYIFDPEAEAVDDDDASADEGSSRGPLWLAGGIVAVALLVGGAIVVSSGTPSVEANGVDGEAAELAAAEEAEGDPEPDDPSPTPEEKLEACREALKDGRWQEAVDHAEAALEARPDDAEAIDCRDGGRSGVAFHRGYDAFQAGALEEAYAAYAEIPEGNPFREHPSIAETVERLADERLTRARKALGKDLDFAAQLVEDVLEMDGVPEEAVARAERMQRLLKARGHRGAKADPSPLQEAMACAQRGDHPCVVQALEGQAGSARALALLIEAQRTLGEREAALENMQRFVRRYPSDRRTSRYEALLDAP